MNGGGTTIRGDTARLQQQRKKGGTASCQPLLLLRGYAFAISPAFHTSLPLPQPSTSNRPHAIPSHVHGFEPVAVPVPTLAAPPRLEARVRVRHDGCYPATGDLDSACAVHHN